MLSNLLASHVFVTLSLDLMRCDPVDLFVASVKIAQIVKAAHCRHLSNAVILCVKHQLGDGKTVSYNVLYGSDPHLLLENAAKMIFADVAKLCKPVHRQMILIIAEDILKGGKDGQASFDYVLSEILGDLSIQLVTEQKREKLAHDPLDHGLVVLLFFVKLGLGIADKRLQSLVTADDSVEPMPVDQKQLPQINVENAVVCEKVKVDHQKEIFARLAFADNIAFQ